MTRTLVGFLAVLALGAGCTTAQTPAAGVDLGAKSGDAVCTPGDAKCADKPGCTPADGQG